MPYKVSDDADIGLLATHSTNLLLSYSLENGFNAVSSVIITWMDKYCTAWKTLVLKLKKSFWILFICEL